MSDNLNNNQPQSSAAIATAIANTDVAREEGLISIEDFIKVKLRVARIEAVEVVPKSKKLLKLNVDLGSQLGKRQILAGIAPYYQPESLVGEKIVVVANLKPAKLMGLESQGMLLAASTKDGTALALVRPDKDLPEGSEVR
jgi:methionyl-tRNA synthetase